MKAYRCPGLCPYPKTEDGPLPAHVDVAVIGGGLTGVLIALRAQERGLRAAVFEAGEVGHGGSGSCLGVLSCGGGLLYHRLESIYGTSTAALYAHLHTRAIADFERLGVRLGLRDDFTRRPALLYTRQWDGALENEASAARRAGLTVELLRRTELPFSVSLALSYAKQASVNPAIFLYGIATQVPVWGGVRIAEVHGHTLVTDEGDEVEATAVVYACRTVSSRMVGACLPAPFFGHSKVLALRDTPPLRGMYCGIDRGGLRLLHAGDRLFLATGMTLSSPDAEGGLADAARQYYPLSAPDGMWELWDTLTADGLPLIGRISQLTPNHYISTGYGGWGMTHAMIAADLITADICGERHPAAELFSPARFAPRGAKRHLRAAEAAAELHCPWSYRRGAVYHGNTPSDTAL